MKSLMKKFLKITLIVCGSLVALAVIVFSCVLYQDYVKQKEEASVIMTIDYKHELCQDNPDYPLLVIVTNRSKRTLKSIGFHVEVYENGRSENLSEYSYFEWHGIVAADKISFACYRMPRIKNTVESLNKLIYRISGNIVIFYREGEFIPKR
jgi:hypothetical protein